MKQTRKIIFIILALLPILPLLCQVISNIGNDNANNIFSWGNYTQGDGYAYYEAPYLEWEIRTDWINGEEVEIIFTDTSTIESTGIYDKLLYAFYTGQEVKTNTLIGSILKLTYNLTNILGLPNTATWLYVMLYTVYMMFIELVMLIVDITLLIPRKIKEWME